MISSSIYMPLVWWSLCSNHLTTFLNNVLTEEEYDVYANKGMFTIRWSEKHSGSVFTDQVIEQDEMRILKISGGLAHGPFPYEALLNISQVYSTHTYIWSTCWSQDYKYYQTYRTWLDSHSPFAYEQCDHLVNIANGSVSENSNAEQAFEIGSRIAQAYEGIPHSDVKCKR